MKILFISTRVPHPKVVSGHLIVYQRVKRLAERGHQVGLAVFGREDDEAHVPEVRDLLCELEIQPPPRSLGPVRRFLGAAFSPIPECFAEYYTPGMFRCVGDMVERTRYDVVVAEFGLMGQYVNRNPYLPAIRKIVSVHHCHSIAGRKALDLLRYSPRALREWVAVQGLQRYEFDMYRSADRLLVLTPEERFGMLTYAPDLRITVVPSGVDTDYFTPGDPSVRENALVYVGYYTDAPNRDAVLWFGHSVWPRLKSRHPDLKFYVVGPAPTPHMLDMARKDPRIIVTGEVEDIRPYLSRAKVFVCPIRLGSGMRGKILQAMACGIPVVSTTLGAEGIPIQMGDNGFLADKPRIIAQYVDLLLTDEALRDRVGARGREWVVERFSWERNAEQLETVVQEVVEGR